MLFPGDEHACTIVASACAWSNRPRMGCLFAIVAGFFPRIALVVVWIATDYVDRAFDTFILPLIGLFVLP